MHNVLLFFILPFLNWSRKLVKIKLKALVPALLLRSLRELLVHQDLLPHILCFLRLLLKENKHAFEVMVGTPF